MAEIWGREEAGEEKVFTARQGERAAEPWESLEAAGGRGLRLAGEGREGRVYGWGGS